MNVYDVLSDISAMLSRVSFDMCTSREIYERLSYDAQYRIGSYTIKIARSKDMAVVALDLDGSIEIYIIDNRTLKSLAETLRNVANALEVGGDGEGKAEA